MKIKRASSASRIATKITKKMATVYTAIYMIVLLILLFLITPVLYHISDQRMTNSVLLMKNTLDNTLDSMVSAVSSLDGITSISNNLKAYADENNDSNKARVELALSSFADTSYNILAITIEDSKQHFFQSNRFSNIITREYSHKDARYNQLLTQSVGSYYTFDPGTNFYIVATPTRNTIFNTLIYTRIMYFNYDPYVVRIYYNANSLINNLTAQAKGDFSDLVLANENQIVYHMKSNHTFILNSNMETNSAGSYYVNGGLQYYSQSTLSNFSIAAFSPFVLFFRTVIVLFLIILAVYFISPILYIFILNPTVDNTLAPLNLLHDAMKEYSIGNNTVVSLKTNDEIEDLCEIYNQMISKINQQYTDLQEKEHINAITNYKLLATQIDPHFIYNTMGIITILAHQGDVDAVEAINSSLIKILRERLSTKLSVFTTIEKELSTLSEYNLIMRYRYKNRIHTQIDVDPVLLNQKIPKNILQPLVENSYYHGFANLAENKIGNISIEIYSMDGNLIIEFSDDGIGMSQERLDMLISQSYEIYKDEKPHIGLDNIRQRLAYLYNNDYEFKMYSSPGNGVTICFTIPLQQ